MTLDRLWAGWRVDYVASADEAAADEPAANDDRAS